MDTQHTGSVRAQLAALPSLPMAELWALWDQHFPRRPSHRNRHYVESRLAYRIQEQAYGALRVVHSLEASQRKVQPNPSPEELARWRARPTHENPLVWTHRNGRKSLVLGASADYIVGMDRDVGYGILRMSKDQKWTPYFLGNPVYAFLLTIIQNALEESGAMRPLLKPATPPQPSDQPSE